MTQYINLDKNEKLIVHTSEQIMVLEVLPTKDGKGMLVYRAPTEKERNYGNTGD